MKPLIYTLASAMISVPVTLALLWLFYSKEASAYKVREIITVEKPWYSDEQLDCLTLGIYGEHGQRGNFEGRLNVGAFMMNEAVKNHRTLCDEVASRKEGGALTYSFYRYKEAVLNRSHKNRLERHAWSECHGIATQFLMTPMYDDMLVKRKKYTNYITVKLAKHPPRWFKDYIVSYEIDGSHVMAELDFTSKRPENYQKLLLDLNG